RDEVCEHFPERRQVVGADAFVERLPLGVHGALPGCRAAATRGSCTRRRREKEMERAEAAATRAGAAATMKMCFVSQCRVSSRPPMSGPTIDPMRPMPSAQPTPVERMAVGYDSAVRALAPICPP